MVDATGSRARLRDHLGSFTVIGPLGPTMNEAGAVAFRANDTEHGAGVFASRENGVATIATSSDGWSEFHGLPVVDDAGSVVFRATKRDGTHGIYTFGGGTLRTVVQTGEEFATLGLFPSVGADGAVSFAATLRDGGAGVFTAEPGGMIDVFLQDGAFETYRGALVAGPGAVICIATPHAGTIGLFTGPDPESDRLIALGDALLGSIVADFASNPVSVNTVSQIAVRVTLDDGRRVVLRGNLPR